MADASISTFNEPIVSGTYSWGGYATPPGERGRYPFGIGTTFEAPGAAGDQYVLNKFTVKARQEDPGPAKPTLTITGIADPRGGNEAIELWRSKTFISLPSDQDQLQVFDNQSAPPLQAGKSYLYFIYNGDSDDPFTQTSFETSMVAEPPGVRGTSYYPTGGDEVGADAFYVEFVRTFPFKADFQSINLATVRGATAGDNRLTGTSDDEFIDGLAGNDKIHGGKGDDALQGELGNDDISGGKGQDKLYGSNGKDRLDGGKGDDWLIGGTGKDVFKLSEGSDSITDYISEERDVVLIDERRFVNVEVNQIGDDAILTAQSTAGLEVRLTILNTAVDDVLLRTIPEL